MNTDIKMSVSSMTRTKDRKAVYVLDGDKTAEFTLPGCALVKNNGFSEDEVKSLKEYVDNEQDGL